MRRVEASTLSHTAGYHHHHHRHHHSKREEGEGEMGAGEGKKDGGKGGEGVEEKGCGEPVDGVEGSVKEIIPSVVGEQTESVAEEGEGNASVEEDETEGAVATESTLPAKEKADTGLRQRKVCTPLDVLACKKSGFHHHRFMLCCPCWMPATSPSTGAHCIPQAVENGALATEFFTRILMTEFSPSDSMACSL